MASTSLPQLLPWVENRILEFFNAVSTAREIVGAIEDFPGDGPGHAIGVKVAVRILGTPKQIALEAFYKSRSDYGC